MRNYFFCITKINDKSFQNDIINFINCSLDVQKKITNVKAKMTSWNVLQQPGFGPLASYMIDFALQVSKERYNLDLSNKISVDSIWGMCYESLDFATPHDHWPCTWSCVYYINPPKNCPELFFSELNQSVYPEDGMLVLFPGHVVHEVPKKEFVGKRYAVAANLVFNI